MAPCGWAARTMAPFLGVALLTACFCQINAQDEAEGVAAADSAEVADVGAAVDDPDAPLIDPGEGFYDSMKELDDKLSQLNELIDAKGDDFDPDLKERLLGLKDQLGRLQDSGLGAKKEELIYFLGACVGMSMRRAGPNKPSTVSALRSLAQDGFTKEQGKGNELVKMIAVCVTDITEQELALQKDGKLVSLPKEMEEKAKTSAGRTSVLELDDDIWADLQSVAKAFEKDLVEEKEKTDPRKRSGDVSTTVGLFALVPIIGAAIFLTKKFLDVQKENEAKKNNKKTKKQK